MRIKILTSACAFFISSVASANFPSVFNEEKMRECITVGGASSDYQDRQKGGSTDASTEEPEEEPDCD